MSDAASSFPFEAVFDLAPHGVALVDAGGRLLRANGRLQRLLGYAEPELATMTLADLVHPGDAAAAIVSFEELVEGGRTHYQLNERLLHKSGGVVWVRATVARCERGSGVVAVATIEDITAARGTEERLHQLVYQLGERVKELTALHHTARALLQRTGTRRDNLKVVAALLPQAMQYPEVATASIRYGEEVYDVGDHQRTPWTLSSGFRSAQGVDGEIEVAYRERRPDEAQGPFLNEEVALLASLAEMIRAAIDREDGERALEEANERLGFAFDTARMGLWEWDVLRNQVRWSPNLSRMLGIEGSVSGPFGNHRLRVHRDDRDRVFDRLARAAEGKDDLQHVQLRMRGADGRFIHFDASAMLPAEPGTPPARILVAMLVVDGDGSSGGGDGDDGEG